jgi:hypothetical protein
MLSIRGVQKYKKIEHQQGEKKTLSGARVQKKSWHVKKRNAGASSHLGQSSHGTRCVMGSKGPLQLQYLSSYEG